MGTLASASGNWHASPATRARVRGMRGGVIGETETRADRRARMRLRKVAGEWFPTIAGDVLDRIVAAAWIEGRDVNGGGAERTAVVAAAAVRRHGLRALRGDGVD